MYSVYYLFAPALIAACAAAGGVEDTGVFFTVEQVLVENIQSTAKKLINICLYLMPCYKDEFAKI